MEIPDGISSGKQTSISEIWDGLKEGINFVAGNRSILMLLVMYCILEFTGAISFDGMCTPLLLARTNNNETIVGIVSSFMAIGCIVASVLLSILKQPHKNCRSCILAVIYVCLELHCLEWEEISCGGVSWYLLDALEVQYIIHIRQLL